MLEDVRKNGEEGVKKRERGGPASTSLKFQKDDREV